MSELHFSKSSSRDLDDILAFMRLIAKLATMTSAPTKSQALQAGGAMRALWVSGPAGD